MPPRNLKSEYTFIHIDGENASTKLYDLFATFQAQPELCELVEVFYFRPGAAAENLRLGHGTLLEKLISQLSNLRVLEVPFDRFNGPVCTSPVDRPETQDALACLTNLRSITFTDGNLNPGDSADADRNLTWLRIPHLREINLVGIKLQPLFRNLPKSSAEYLHVSLPYSFRNPYDLVWIGGAFARLKEISIEILEFPRDQEARCAWTDLIGQCFIRLRGLQTLKIDFKDTAALRRAGEVHTFGHFETLRTLMVPVGWFDFAIWDATVIAKRAFPPNIAVLGLHVNHFREIPVLRNALVAIANAKLEEHDALPYLRKIMIGMDPKSELWYWMQKGVDGLPELTRMGVGDTQELWSAIEDLRDIGVRIITDDLSDSSLSEDEG